MDKNKIIEAAAKLIAKGAYDKAIKEYQKVLDADPKDVRVLQKMGELYQKKNDNVLAAQFFTKVAEGYSADGFFLKAVALYKQVLKLNPNLLEVNLKLAELHQQLGLVSEAMAYFQIVANHYDKGGDTRSSLDTLKRMVDLDPDNVASRVKLAELYAREGMNAEALPEFRHAADYLQRNNRTEDYLRVAERLSTLQPENIPLAKELATSYLSRGDQKRALAKLQICFKADSRDTQTLHLLAEAFQGLGQMSKTLSVYKELARIHEEQGASREGQAIWDKVQALDPQDADLLARRGVQAAPTSPAQPRSAPAPAPAAPQPAAPQAAAAPPPPGPPPSLNKDQLAKLLTETDVYLKYGLHDKALEHLRKIFSVDPENIDAHEKAYSIYVSSGNTAQAFEQLLNVLRLCTRRSDVERAQPYLASILEQSPKHPELPAFLAVLQNDDTPLASSTDDGIPEDTILVDSQDEVIVVSEAPPDALAQPEGDELALATVIVQDSDEVLEGEEALYDDSLVSDDLAAAAYDEAELDAEEETVYADEPELVSDDDEPLVTSSGEDDEDEAAEYVLEDDLVSADDAAEEVVSEVEEEAPAAPYLDETSETTDVGIQARVTPPAEESFEEEVSDTFDTSASSEVSASFEASTEASTPFEEDVSSTFDTSSSSEVSASFEAAVPDEGEPASEECDEASFFLDQGLLEEAREILETVAIAFPGHARAAELTERLEAMEAAGAQPVQEEEVSETVVVPAMEPVGSDEGGRDAFDLAAELAGEIDELGGSSEPAPAAGGDDFQYSVEEVFAEFKKGLEKVVKPEDVDTHYDLGIAYKEMGLVDDAIGEFVVAREGCVGKKREVDCLTMMGLLQGMKGDFGSAVQAFKDALLTEFATGELAKALTFELAVAYEGQGSLGKALFHFQNVANADATYREVNEHVERLASTTQPEEDRLAPAAKANPGAHVAGAPGRPPLAAGARKVGYV